MVRGTLVKNLWGVIGISEKKKKRKKERKKEEEEVLTAQFGSKASIVGERPRYIPFKPSVFIMFSRLVIMILPECSPNKSSNNGHSTMNLAVHS